MPDGSTRRLYESYASNHYSHIRPEGLSAGLRAHFRANILPWLPRDRACRLLDIGCGHGDLLAYLKELGYQDASGIDISQEQIDEARARELNVTCIDATAYLKASQVPFDAIVAVDFLEHVAKRDLVELVEHLASSLGSEGVLVIQTANAEGPFGSRYRYADLTHEIAFTRTSIEQLFRTAGLTPVYVGEVKPALHGAASLLRWMVWHTFRQIWRLYLAAETGVTAGHVLSLNLIAVAKPA